MDTKIRSWAADEYETGARVQAEATGRAQGVKGVAIMPDAHVGIGACIGTVIATEGTIIPAAVGVDLGCGMTARKLPITADMLPDNLDAAIPAFTKAVPAINHDDHRQVYPGLRRQSLGWIETHPLPRPNKQLAAKAYQQLGTLGRGNHFLEVAVCDADGGVWMVLHSGSRGVGNILAREHIKIAQTIDKAAEDRDLAAFVFGTAEFDAYVADMRWSQRYAFKNREMAMDAAMLSFCTDVLGYDDPLPPADAVACHHNYADIEVHDGATVWITRKGAISAQVGERGIIPGSMGTSTFIVEGLGNSASFCSASHGAGRAMSRRQAKRELDQSDFEAQMAGRVWQADQAGALLDEAPGAYKDLGTVMAAQADLCRPVYELHAVVNYKGT